MSIVNGKRAFSVGICPEFIKYLGVKRNLYDENPSMLERDLKSLEERGIIKVIDCKKNQCTLTLILKKDGQVIKEVEIEGVDHLQCMFLISNIDMMTENGCRQPCCELTCCVLKKLTAKLQ